MKILITTDLFTTATNGVVTSVKNLWSELKNKGHDVRILTLSENTHSHKDGEVYYIRSMPIGIYPDVRMPLSYRHKLIKELIKWKPDIIHSQCEFFSMQYAKRISKITGAPIVHTYHTLYEEYAGYIVPWKKVGQMMVNYVIHKRMNKVSLVIVPTTKIKNVLEGYDIEKSIRIIPTGISLDQHKKRITEEARRAKRESLGISEDDTVLINLGRLGTEKNLDELVELFGKALSKNDKLKFLIVGDGPAKKDLEKQAKSLGIEDHVIFTGMVPPTEVQEYYQLGDIFVSASISETQGLTYIEAAANGMPLLCRQDDCLTDVIKTGENGYAYTCEEEFLEELSKMLKNTEWLKAAKKVSEEIAAAYDKETFGNAVEEVYTTILENIAVS